MSYETLKNDLQSNPKIWLITGVAGFIGSNLLEILLKLNQNVVGIDNFLTGYERNLTDVQEEVTESQWKNFVFVRGDIQDLALCHQVCAGVDYVLHQAALGSVPRSIDNPINTNANNIDGFLNMLVAARDADVKRFVYASSSSVYGDSAKLPKVENDIGKPLSPYAVTKTVNEMYADVFAKTYNLQVIGLRYFNVFGKRQDPHGAYAAVIPKWISALLNNEAVFINGDGKTSRDFCYIENAIQANLLAATVIQEIAVNQVYNVAVGERTTLLQLYQYIREILETKMPEARDFQPSHRDFRKGDVLHSLADISKAKELLAYNPQYKIVAGLQEAIQFYISSLKEVS